MMDKKLAFAAAILMIAAAAFIIIPAGESDGADVSSNISLTPSGTNLIVYAPAVCAGTATYEITSDGSVVKDGEMALKDLGNGSAAGNISGFEYDETKTYTIKLTFANSDTASKDFGASVEPEDKLDSITISGQKTDFKYGEEFSYYDLVVTAHYTIGEDKTVDANIDYRAYDANTAGTYTIYVSYTENGITATTSYDVTVAEKSVDPEEPVSEDIVFMEDTQVAGGTVWNGTVTVNPGVTITFVGEGNVTVNGNLYLYGSLMTDDDRYVVVNKDALLKAFAGATVMPGISLVGSGNIDIADAMSTMTINDDVVSSNTYSQTQVVVIAESLNLRAGTTTTILGKLLVNEGVTLTIEKNATLVIDSQTAEMLINGKVIVEEGATILVDDAKGVTVQGTLESEGEVCVDSTVTIKSGAKVLIDSSDSSKLTVTEGLTVETGAELEIRGMFDIYNVTNKGTITLNDAAIDNNSNITLAADDATVIVKSFVSKGAYVLTVKDSKNTVKIDAVENMGLAGLSIKTVKDVLYLSGNVIVVDDTKAGDGKAPKFTVSGTAVKVTDSLTLGADVKIETSAYLTVEGTIDATATGSAISNSGTIDVPGTVKAVSDIGGTINAALYKDGVNVYTNLPAAVASGTDTINLLGTVKLTEDLEVPADVRIKGSTAELIIGSSENRDVTLIMKDGSEIRQGYVTVDGTLIFENKKNNKATQIISDVAVVGEESAKYTNIYTALDQAVEGDVVTTTKNSVNLDKDATVKAGVTLSILNGKELVIGDKVTLTVSGVLKAAGTVRANNVFDVTAGEEKSAIKVDGIFMSMGALKYEDYKTAGAYFNMVDSNGNYNYITTVEYAASVVQGITPIEDDFNTVAAFRVYGDNTVADITISGTTEVGMIITEGAELKASSVTLENGFIIVKGTYNGTVASEAGSVGIVNVKHIFAIGDKTALAIGGTPIADDSEKASSITIVSGTVNAVNDLDVTGLGSFAITEGSTLSVATIGDFGAKFTATSLTVDGTLSVTNGGVADIGTLTVKGTLTVGAADDKVSAGSVTVIDVYVGMTSADLNGNATIEGVPDISGLLYAINGSVIDDALVSDKKSTEFIVEGTLWMTVYYFDEYREVKDVIAPVDNAEPLGWGSSADSKEITDVIDCSMSKVYAVIKYDVYKVSFVLAEGIDDVYVDGILVDLNSLYTYLKAGEHTVTCTLANGYSGNAIMLVNSEKVSGNKFTTTGNDFETSVYKITLQGIEKSGFVPESPDVPSEPTEKDDSLGITEYLLIVLVILAAILVIVVAIRMMRS